MLNLIFALLAVMAPVEQSDADLICRATHELECEGIACRHGGEGASIPVVLTVVSSSGVGNLCTFTYCRDFMLVPGPGKTVQDAVESWTGFTLSERSSSTDGGVKKPTLDYQLSISRDRDRFFLGNLVDGGFGGWVGECSSPGGDAGTPAEP